MPAPPLAPAQTASASLPDGGTGTASDTQTPAWTDPQREALFHRWLAAQSARHGLAPGSLRMASADASFRRYFRVDATAGGSRIVMDAPPALEDSRPFVQVAELMAQAGLRVPRILDWQQDHGFLLLDDLGSDTLIARLDPAAPQAALPWYLNAVDALVRWQQASRPGVLPEYDAPLLRRELELFPDWYLAQHRGVAIDGALRATLDGSFDAIVKQNLQAPAVYVHRDFMPRNLMVADGAASAADAPLGVLDFQDAVHGPITYDIACLMRDAFLSWEEDMVLEVTVRYWEKARRAGLLGATSASGWGADFGEFYRAVDWMALQRHLKVAGIFARITLRDGKPRYLGDTPRFIRYIRTTAGRYRELTPLLRLVDAVEGTADASGFAFGRM